MRRFQWSYLGRRDYADALGLQGRIHEAVVAGRSPGVLLLLEHPPTITLGRHGDARHLLVSVAELERRGVGFHRIDRGGDVTYHGPGQLVGYPVLPVERGVRQFVHALADGARRVLEGIGIPATWREDQPGLWVEGEGASPGKIAAVGLNVRHRVATHGFALNVSPDLAHYAMIVPCGLATESVTSVRALLGHAPPLREVAEAFVAVYQPFATPALAEEVPAGALNHFLT